jgi:hypothetical protein
MKSLPVACALTITLSSGSAGAQSPAAPEPAAGGISSALHGDFHLVGHTLSRTIRTELLPDDAARWTYLGSLAAVSAYLESQKERLRQDVLDSNAERGWTDVGGELGKGRLTQAAAVLLYGGGLLAGQPRVRHTGLLLAESYAAAQTTAGLLNYVVSETRPQEGGEIRYFHRGGSSVSLHMTNTMVLAEVLDHQVTRIEAGDSAGRRAAKILGKVVLYSIPTVTAWQRVHADEHFLWNVVLGAGQSFYVTRGVLRAHDAETGRPPWLPQLALGGGPATAGGRGTMLLRWTF